MSNSTESTPTMKKEKSVQEMYQQMEHKRHIFEKPDTYVGSCEPEVTSTPVYESNETGGRIKYKDVSYSPGWYKCFDELIVNSHDHKKRMEKKIADDPSGNHKPVTVIKLSINYEDGSIEFYNDGDGIHIEYLEKYKVYPPELIFFTLLSSTNFDDNEEREWGGRNGYGAKLANIFGKKFRVETVDHFNKKKLVQEYSENMTVKTKPKITSITKDNPIPYTKITWLPDYERFGMTGMNDELESIIKKRIYDISGITSKNTKVYFNNKIVEVKDFEKYVDLYLGPKTEVKRAYEESNGWQIIATSSSDEIFEQVSFVNGICTQRGGTHVDYIADQIKVKLAEYLKKKKKLDIKPQIIKNQLKLFVNAYKIVNPRFDTQTKETLKTPKLQLGNMFDISNKFIDQLAKTSIIEKIERLAAYKDSQSLSKTDGKKSKRVRVPKLTDANKAGTQESIKCNLILTEGDSAKSMAVAGLSEVGRDYYGVYPLRGKVQNIRGIDCKKILNCEIINTIKTILGLQSGIDYNKKYKTSNIWPLRYGKIILMTDQDHDGSHIKGLIMNIFDVLWPELLKMEFITCLITPIVKVFKAKQEKAFYTIQDYDKWKQENSKGWTVKYYKGLGTSTSKEAKEYFRKLNIITYYPEDNLVSDVDESSSNEGIEKSEKIKKLDLAFNSERADDRKQWLSKYDRSKIPNYKTDRIKFNDFVDEELIHYSIADNIRSIPSFMDGLKPATRKVLFCAFKRKLKQEIKVAQLSGYTSEHSCYHHGEVSLEATIKGMAQDFVGTNNINLLEGVGQFGTRLQGGKDAAQSRYIFTKLNDITKVIFKDNDSNLCTYLDDDGTSIEPEYYYPIIPFILVNGTQGIGTGYSTKIPQYNPLDIIKYIKNMIEGKESDKLKPWYRGFKGRIEPTSKGNFITRGSFKMIKNDEIEITELPVGTWTDDYIEFLEKHMIDRGKEGAKNFIKSYQDSSSEDHVSIKIKMNPDTLSRWINGIGNDGLPNIELRLKLTSSLTTSNIYAFDEKCKIIKFNNVEDLIENWFSNRITIYQKRKDYILSRLKKELDIIDFKVRFISEIVEGVRIINKKKKNVIIEELERDNYLKIGDKEGDTASFDYLLNMNLYKLTYEEIEELKNKQELKKIEYDTLYSKSVNELWSEDLDELEKTWKLNLNKYNNEHNTQKKKKIIVKK